MFSKYIAATSKKHWIKAMLPLILLTIVLMLNGFITDQINSFFVAKAGKVKDIFNIQLGSENASFADALSKERSLQPAPQADYSGFLDYKFFQRQKNNKPELSKPSEVSSDNNNNSAEISVMPSEPMYNISSIFIGKNKRFAIINDKVTKIGDILDSREKVVRIEDGKVQFKGPWGERWVFVNY